MRRRRPSVSSLPGTEVVPVSAASGAGLDELRAAVARAAGRVARPAGVDAARLYVDRVFAPAGVGTVVTGTLWSGEVAVGDRLAGASRRRSPLASAASRCMGRRSIARPPASGSR